MSPTQTSGTLYLVPTPIGNLEDITLRSLKILNEVDTILCEDTRKTAILLAKYTIQTPRLSVHEHNEEGRTPRLIDDLKHGKNFALVSDAGTPLQSDPGYYLTRACIQNDVNIIALPGANAALTGLIVSGLPPYPYLFMGFLPPKQLAKTKLLNSLQQGTTQGLNPTLIFYESPKRLLETLKLMGSIFGAQRKAYVGRELTKKFEEHIRAPLGRLVEHFTQHKPRGEIVIVIGPAVQNTPPIEVVDKLLPVLLKDHSLKAACKDIASRTSLSTRDIYQYALRHKLHLKNH